MSWKIAITMETHGNKYEGIQDYLKELGFEPSYRPIRTGSPEDVIERLKDVDACIAGGDTFSAEVLNALNGKLKMIARFGIGVDKVDLETATKLGIPVSNTPGLMSPPVAEMAISLLLSLSRGVCAFNNRVKSGDWWVLHVGTQLENKTVGLVGFGSIAQKFVQYIKGFNCRVIAYDTYFNEQAAKELGVTRCSLDDVAQQSDFISLHVPLTAGTKGIIGNEFFNKMKKTAFLINTSRGPVVNEKELIHALENGQIAGAALDVFDKEPVAIDNPLLKMDNVVCTPHIAAHTYEGNNAVGMRAADNIFDFYSGRVPRNIVNPDYVRR